MTIHTARPTSLHALRGLVLLLLLSACTQRVALHGAALQPPKQAPPIALTDHLGRPFTLDQTHGKLVLIYFGYTTCPDVCPLTLAQLAATRRELGADGARVQVLFVTVDPERDTPEVLARYVAAFDPTFLALRSAGPELEAVLRAYDIVAVRRPAPNSALGYTMDHTAHVTVIDPAGWLRERLPYGTPVEDIVADARTLLR